MPPQPLQFPAVDHRRGEPEYSPAQVGGFVVLLAVRREPQGPGMPPSLIDAPFNLNGRQGWLVSEVEAPLSLRVELVLHHQVRSALDHMHPQENELLFQRADSWIVAHLLGNLALLYAGLDVHSLGLDLLGQFGQFGPGE